MKIQVKAERSKRSKFYVFLFLLLLFGGLITACDSPNKNSPTKDPTPNLETTTPASEEPASSEQADEDMELNIVSMAETIVDNVGEISLTGDSNSNPQIVIFEERHDSRAGQLEIAVMLTRLYRDYNLRYIALEGAFSTDPPLDVAGYDVLADANTLMDIAVQLLREGEISSAEFMALALPEVAVQGVEDATEYAIEPEENASSTPILYLFYIALPSLSDAEFNEFNKLFEADKTLEAVEFVINTDEWTQRQYEKLLDNTTILSAEELLELLNEIENKAEENGTEIDPELKAGLQDYKLFFETASKRSETMVHNTITLLAESPDAPIAMIIGAAHTTRVAELLNEQNISYVVIQPTALLATEGIGELSFDAYERKLQARSVDEEGELGALLEDRKKPPSVLQQHWFRVKAQVNVITTRLARAVAAGGKPPFNEPPYDLQTEFASFEHVTVNWDSIVITDDEPENQVVFSFNIQIDEAGTVRTFWGRAVQNETINTIDTSSVDTDVSIMEELLLEALEKVRSEPTKEDNGTEVEPEVSEEGKETETAHDVIAKFASTQEGVSTAIRTG